MAASWHRVRNLVVEARPPIGFLVFALVLALLEAGASLVVPLLTKQLVESMGASGIQWSVLGFILGALLIQAFAGAGSHGLLGYAGHEFVARLRQKILAKLVRLPISFFDSQKSGELISRVINDSDSLTDLITNQLVLLVTNLAIVCGALVILWWLDGTMTLILFGAVFMAVLTIVPLAWKFQEIAKKTQDETARLSGQLAESFGSIRLVKASCAENYETDRGRRAFLQLRNLGRREVRIQAWLVPVLSMAIMGALVLILASGGIRVREGLLSIGEWIAFILYLFHVTVPIFQISNFVAESQRALGASERMLTLLDEKEETPGGDKPLPSATRSIFFKDVSFSYPTREGRVLEGLNFEIPAGQVTALVGPSGSGKTTLVSLLEQFYAPSCGEITLGDTPIGQYPKSLWRRKLGYVAQEVPLIDGSILENLCYGLEREPSKPEIERAVELAYARDFIAEMPASYETRIGERGQQLSGGQRQRLAIARALLRNPDILILDEATSNLDAEAEYFVRKALANLMARRTVLVIAHRLTTVMGAHRVAMLEEGRITGVGGHEELMQHHERYRQLVERQLQMNHEPTH